LILRWFDKIAEHRIGAIILAIIRIAIGGLFVYASLNKIWDPAAFAAAIYNYRLLPEVLLHFAAILLPWLEFITGVLLIINVYPRTSSALIFLMLLMFTLAIISAMARGLDFSCGCFKLDSDARNMSIWKVFENIGMLLMAAIAWLQAQRKNTSVVS
jgi:uncharacterized membrane protein YphA (DoxX/SURF4 family)